MTMYEPEPTNEAWHLLRKVFLLFLVVTALALGLVLLARVTSNIPLVLFNIMADASLGLLAGLATRFVLTGRNWFIRGIASGAMALVGLAILGAFTNWRSGIGPFYAGLVAVHSLEALHIGPLHLGAMNLPLGFASSRMDLVDLVHAVIAMDASWIALRVWKQGATAAAPAPARRVKRPARPAPQPLATPAPQPSAPPPPARHIPSSAPAETRSRVKHKKKTDRAVISRPAPAIRAGRSKTRRLAASRHAKPAVRLAVHEEHRCPYCLDPVKRNDPRGVVECQICHTLHHKDCWDITGNCQVPHLTTL